MTVYIVCAYQYSANRVKSEISYIMFVNVHTNSFVPMQDRNIDSQF